MQVKSKQSFVKLNTLDDASDVAEEYAFILKLIERLEEAQVLLLDDSKANDEQREIILDETIEDSKEMFWRAEFAASILEDIKGKVERFLKGRK